MKKKLPLVKISFLLLIACSIHPVLNSSAVTNESLLTPLEETEVRSGHSYTVSADTLLYTGDFRPQLTTLSETFQQKGFNLVSLINDSRFEVYETIGQRFTRSAERRSVDSNEYKQVLGFDDKRNRISEFITTNIDYLAAAEEQYDIPKFVIAAIIGIESDYGKNVGSYNPFNSYVSMIAVDYRADFASAQLEELLLFCEKNDLDVFDLKSSYAGAVSYAQFIPYSLNRWFVGRELYDMNNNISSVANYLAHFKEITGSLEEAIYRYNPSRLYTGAVMDLAREAEEIYSSS